MSKLGFIVCRNCGCGVERKFGRQRFCSAECRRERLREQQKRLISREELLLRLYYDPETGVFRWRVSGHGKIIVGNAAGRRQRGGYLWISLFGRAYQAHRLAWLYVHGAWPLKGMDIDHRDGRPDNNRIDNLRLCTRSQNMANTSAQRRSKSGLKGVSQSGPKWRARIYVLGRNVTLGLFDSPEQAHAAYNAASIKHFGDFAYAARQV